MVDNHDEIWIRLVETDAPGTDANQASDRVIERLSSYYAHRGAEQLPGAKFGDLAELAANITGKAKPLPSKQRISVFMTGPAREGECPLCHQPLHALGD